MRAVSSDTITIHLIGCDERENSRYWRIDRAWPERDMKFDRITVNPKQMDGVPCIRALRIPVATVVGMIAEGMSKEEILKAYPDLEPDDIREAVFFAAEALRERELPFVAIREVLDRQLIVSAIIRGATNGQSRLCPCKRLWSAEIRGRGYLRPSGKRGSRRCFNRHGLRNDIG